MRTRFPTPDEPELLVPPDRTALANFDAVQPSSIVIVGAGAAGRAAAATLRRAAYTGTITLIDGDDGAPFEHAPHWRDYQAGRALEGHVPRRAARFYDEHDVNVVQSTATALNVRRHAVRVANGSSHEYDALLIATGARPRVFNVPGHDQPHVHVLRSLADCRHIIAQAAHADRVVIMDASVMGLELSASLRNRGLTVHVIDPDENPLVNLLGKELGAMIQQLHEEHGVTFHLEQQVARIERNAVILTNGERLMADMVVVGVGVLSRLDLARAAGLAIDRGVSVNEYLETSVPGVYAAGDIARWPDPHTRERIRVEHWVISQRQGETAARNMLGAREKFDPRTAFGNSRYDLSVRSGEGAQEGAARQRSMSSR